MGVKISTLGVPMAESDFGTVGNIGRDSSHLLGVQGRLELSRHETISVTGVDEAEEVDPEHKHVEAQRDSDQAESTSSDVLDPTFDGYVLGVTEQHPELENGDATDPGDGEETDPFDAKGGT